MNIDPQRSGPRLRRHDSVMFVMFVSTMNEWIALISSLLATFEKAKQAR